MYEGKFLSDMSQEAKENIDKPKVQSLEDLLKDLDDAEEEENIQPHLQKDESDEDEDLDAMFDNLMDVEEDIDEDEE